MELSNIWLEFWNLQIRRKLFRKKNVQEKTFRKEKKTLKYFHKRVDKSLIKRKYLEV